MPSFPDTVQLRMDWSIAANLFVDWISIEQSVSMWIGFSQLIDGCGVPYLVGGLGKNCWFNIGSLIFGSIFGGRASGDCKAGQMLMVDIAIVIVDAGSAMVGM